MSRQNHGLGMSGWGLEYHFRAPPPPNPLNP